MLGCGTSTNVVFFVVMRMIRLKITINIMEHYIVPNCIQFPQQASRRYDDVSAACALPWRFMTARHTAKRDHTITKT